MITQGGKAAESSIAQLRKRLEIMPELFSILNGHGTVRNVKCCKGGPIRESLIFQDEENRFCVGLDFAPKGSQCRQHQHKGCLEYLIVIGGRLGCVMRKKEESFKKVAQSGEYIFIPSNTPHKVLAFEDTTFLAITIPAAKGMRYGETR